MHIQEKRKIILNKIDKMPDGDLSDLFEFIQSLENKTEIKTHFASEKVLAKDWNKEEEEEAWKDL